jgi:rsbT co-antagonist protein RsbR
MGLSNGSKIPEVVEKYEAQLLADWIQALVANNASKGLIKETQLREECQEFLSLLKDICP